MKQVRKNWEARFNKKHPETYDEHIKYRQDVERFIKLLWRHTLPDKDKVEINESNEYLMPGVVTRLIDGFRDLSFDMDLLKKIVALYNIDLNNQHYYGAPPLERAYHARRAKVFEVLLELGADPNMMSASTIEKIQAPGLQTLRKDTDRDNLKEIKELFQQYQNRRQKGDIKQRVTATPAQLEQFFTLGKGFVKFYRKWEAENRHRKTLSERLPFAELINAFGNLAMGEMPGFRVQQFAAYDCIQLAYIGFLLTTESRHEIRQTGEIPYSMLQILKASDVEDMLGKMYWLLVTEGECNRQFAKMFEHDFAPEILEEREEKRRREAEEREERERAAELARDEAFARQLDELPEFPGLERADANVDWANVDWNPVGARRRLFPDADEEVDLNQAFIADNDEDEDDDEDDRLFGGSPCGLPPWHSPKRYANNRYNLRWKRANKSCTPRKVVRRGAKLPSPKTSRRKTTPKQPVVDTILSRGKELGRGRQSVVYEYKGYAWKIFDDTSTSSMVQQNINFLRANRNTGSVPKMYDANAREGWIKMELLEDYTPLSSVVNLKAPEYKEQLLRKIARARSKMSKSTEFTDMTKWGNIGVKHDATGRPLRVKFYEGGRSDEYSDNLRAWLFVKEMAGKLRIKSSDFAKHVDAQKVDWLV